MSSTSAPSWLRAARGEGWQALPLSADAARISFASRPRGAAGVTARPSIAEIHQRRAKHLRAARHNCRDVVRDGVQHPSPLTASLASHRDAQPLLGADQVIRVLGGGVDIELHP